MWVRGGCLCKRKKERNGQEKEKEKGGSILGEEKGWLRAFRDSLCAWFL
mgnify:CR=1 FL=1